MLLLACWACSDTQSVYGTNPQFLSGDAYFASSLSEDSIKEWQKSKQVTLNYNLYYEGAFCGFKGYDKLVLEDKNNRLAANLEFTYRYIRNTWEKEVAVLQKYELAETDKSSPPRMIPAGPPVMEESNPLPVFVYNADFDPGKARLLHRYNETWDEGEQNPYIGTFPKEIMDTPRMIVHSLKYGKHVPPLAVRPQKTDDESEEPPVLNPSGDLKLIVIPNRGLMSEIINRSEYGATIYIVTHN